MNNVYSNGIDLSVTVNGRPTRIYTHESRYFIESREGTEYVIEISNKNWYRVEAVVSVDGLSVMNGEAASTEDYGYVIPSYGSIKIKGYRKNMEEVGAFKFSKKEQSYAATQGESKDNVGVIGIAIWKEKVPEVNGSITLSSPTFITTTGTYPWYSGTTTTMTTPTVWAGSATAFTSGSVGSTSNSVSCMTASNCTENSLIGGVLRSATVDSTPSFDHGTTWGTKLDDKVVTTNFTRDYIISQTEVFYNSRQNLEAMGIKLVQEKQIAMPLSFPRSFATPPSGWKS